jgi:hypothetical protein
MGFGYGSIAGRWVYWREVGSSSYKDHVVLLRERPVNGTKAIISYATCVEVVGRAPLLLTLVLAVLVSLPSRAGMKPWNAPSLLIGLEFDLELSLTLIT